MQLDALERSSLEDAQAPRPATPLDAVDAVARDDVPAVVRHLESLAASAACHGLPAPFLELTRTALRTGDWDLLSGPFIRLEFVGPDGRFLLVAPYLVRRNGSTTTRLTAIHGQVVPHERLTDLHSRAAAIFEPLRQPIPLPCPVRLFASAGAVGTESGEAFIVPDGWTFADSITGPAMNDVGEQCRRFYQSGFECIRRIFEPESARLLLQSLEEGEALRSLHFECSYHEAGHACGYGLQHKDREGVLSSAWRRGVEEWRTDGVEYRMAAALSDPADMTRVVATNLCIRFGIDAHRAGGAERDVDVIATLLNFDRLVRGGGVRIGATGRLEFTECSPAGLARAVEGHAAEASALTREEHAAGTPEAIGSLYDRVQVSHRTHETFASMVTGPCSGVYHALR